MCDIERCASLLHIPTPTLATATRRLATAHGGWCCLPTSSGLSLGTAPSSAIDALRRVIGTIVQFLLPICTGCRMLLHDALLLANCILEMASLRAEQLFSCATEQVCGIKRKR